MAMETPTATLTALPESLTNTHPNLPDLSLCLPGLTIDTQAFPTVNITVGKKTTLFWAEYRKVGTPQQIQMAVLQAKEQANKTGQLPLVIVPYLSEERLLGLEQSGVSGIDLCGNGMVIAPGLWFFRTGFPNRFKSSAPIKNIYRGASSLVARVFLLKREYDRVGDIETEIVRRGGEISPGTVSKVLKELEAEILVGRGSGTIRLLQPEGLLERLVESFTLPKAEATFTGKVEGELAQIERIICQIPATLVVRTGTGSLDKYVTMATQPKLCLYTSSLSTLLGRLDATATTRFPNIEIIETSSPLPFFDAREMWDAREIADARETSGTRKPENQIRYASPLQTYLEMMQGDERLQQTALSLRERLIVGDIA
jgi:hypothetical protein